jgi:hypothetical protein
MHRTQSLKRKRKKKKDRQISLSISVCLLFFLSSQSPIASTLEAARSLALLH